MRRAQPGEESGCLRHPERTTMKDLFELHRIETIFERQTAFLDASS
jgi:hypothetical protein